MEGDPEQSDYPQLKYDKLYKKHQVDEVKEHLGISILSPVHGGNELDHSWEELKLKFPERAEEYLHSLRELGRIKKGEKIPVDEIAKQRSKILQLNLDDYITHHEALPEGEGTLRPYQMEVFKAITHSLKEGTQEGYVKLPTGTGKTVLFTEFLEAARMKTLLVVPSQILVNQAGEEVDAFATDLDVGKIYAESKTHGKDVTITTYNSLLSGVASGTLKPENYGLLILDEVHRALTESRVEAIKKFSHSVTLGFTATPKFNEKKQVANLLPTEIYKKSIEAAANEHLIAPFLPYVIETSLDLSNVTIQNGDYNKKELEKAINVKGRNLAAVEVYKQRPELCGSTAVAYCAGVAHATALAGEFLEQGVNAAVISGKTRPQERKSILQEYKEGKIQVLCNADLLIEGFNEPRASVCLNLRPTQSIIVAEQRAGRILRLDRNNEDKIAYVVDFLDNADSLKKRPVLFSDIVNMTAIAPRENKQVLPVSDDTHTESAEELQVNGLTVKIHVLPEDVLKLSQREVAIAISSQKETKEIRNVMPWYTWDQAKLEYGLPEESKLLVEHSAAWHTSYRRERQDGDGNTVIEYTPQAIERACSKIVINEIVDNINSLSQQSDVILGCAIKVFMEESILTNSDMVKEFMKFLSSDDRKKITQPELIKKALEETQFVRKLRDFSQLHAKDLSSERFREASKEARSLAA